MARCTRCKGHSSRLIKRYGAVFCSRCASELGYDRIQKKSIFTQPAEVAEAIARKLQGK